MMKDIPRIGIIFAMYDTTSSSLLYMYPQILRSKFMVMATKTPSDKANNITTLIANFAA
jgi:hypothetical protein